MLDISLSQGIGLAVFIILVGITAYFDKKDMPVPGSICFLVLIIYTIVAAGMSFKG